MTQMLENAFKEAAKLPSSEQDKLADFILEELAFCKAVQKGIEAADRDEVRPLEEVKKLIPKWASK